MKIGITLLVTFLMVAWCASADATYRHDKAVATAKAQQDQEQWQKQVAKSDAKSKSIADAAAVSSNEGNELSVNSTYESGPGDLVLVPNNNTENCLRVFGFAFGNDQASGMLGLPWRSKNCDFKGLAADAAAYGDHDTAWYWRCHMKSAYKTFKDRGETKEVAIEQCHAKMVGGVSNLKKIENLQEGVKTLLNENIIERKKCDESKNRIMESCYKK